MSWSEVNDEIVKRHFKNKKSRVDESIIERYSDISSVFHFDEKGNSITDFESYFINSRKAPHSSLILRMMSGISTISLLIT